MSRSYQRKIVGLSTLIDRANAARREGNIIVQCHGCFDIVHPGHVRYLEFARQQGDLLIVTLTADASISKSPSRPYIPQELRAENLAALELVDYVYVDPSPTAESVLDALRPDIYVKGAEYEQSRDPGFLRERAIVEEYGGRVIFSSGETVFSSTRLIESLSRQEDLEQQKIDSLRKRHQVTPQLHLEAINRFQGLRVAVVGDIVVDRYTFCDATGVASDAPTLTLAELREEEFVGGAGIVARHLAALGATPFLLAATSTDELAERVAGVLDQQGVERHLIPSRPSLPQKTRFLVEANKVLRIEKAVRVPLDTVAERDATNILLDRVHDFDALILCDFGYGTVTSALLEQVLPAYTAADTIVSADSTGSRARLLQCRGIDLLCPSERELRTTLHDFDGGLSSVAWNLLHSTQARQLAVTLGTKGLVTFQRRSTESEEPGWTDRLKSDHLPSMTRQRVDQLGTGDALLTVATLGLTTGLTLIQAAWLGMLAAAAEESRLGNVPIDVDTLRNQVVTHMHPLIQPNRKPTHLLPAHPTTP